MCRVLMAVEESVRARSVLAVFRKIVPEPDSVILIHVRRQAGRWIADSRGKAALKNSEDTSDEKAEKIIDFYKSALATCESANVKEIVRKGIPSEEILKVAREEMVDLIILTGNGRLPLRGLMRRCGTKDVERAATVPVLVA